MKITGNIFQPSEITVKTVDQTVVIEGKHVERDDGYGSVSRHFIRKYVLPKEYDMNTVHTSLSSDGILTIKGNNLVTKLQRNNLNYSL